MRTAQCMDLQHDMLASWMCTNMSKTHGRCRAAAVLLDLQLHNCDTDLGDVGG